MKKALIIVDIQNDYFKGGKYELFEPELAAEHAKELLEHFRRFQLPVIHVRHISLSPTASFFLPDTTGSEIYAGCSPIADEVVIIKHRPDSFLNTDLQETLQEQDIQELVICGMMSHMCIDTTVRKANSLGYTVELIEDACATRDLEWKGRVVPAEQVQNAFMSAIDGSFAKVISTKTWIEQQR